MTHKAVQQLLYEYIRDELHPVQHEEVRAHLSMCGRCTRELKELYSLLEVLPTTTIDASTKRSEDFWSSFPTNVEDRIRSRRAPEQKSEGKARWRAVSSFIAARPRLLPALGSAVALAIIAVVAWQVRSPVKPQSEQAAILQPILESASDRLAEYFRKSKVLLVGLTNLKASETEPVDLSFERQRSQELLLSARAIPRDSLDRYSAMVADDLEKVLGEIAEARREDERGKVELVQVAIRQQNLIFKLRMIESMRESPQIVTTRDETR